MKPQRMLALVIAAVVAVLLLKTCFFVVDRGEAAVVAEFGKPVRVVDGPGLYVKAPAPLQSVRTLDCRLNVWTSEPTEYVTADTASVVLSVYVAWRISDAGTFVLAAGTKERAEERIGDVVTSVLGRLVARHPMGAFASTQPADVLLPEVLRSTARESQEPLSKLGVSVADLGVVRVGLPDGARDVVIGRMAAGYDARAALEVAAGEEEAARIRAAADSERQVVLADARGESERIRSEADAAAMRIYADAHAADPEFYRFLRTLESYRVVMNDRTSVVMSSRSELFKLLDEKD